MAMMDEACLNVGNTTDTQLLDAMDSQLAQSKYYSSKKKDATKNKVCMAWRKIRAGLLMNDLP